MCLGIPGQIIAIDGLVATVDFWGARRRVNLHIVDEPVALGDYVLNHVGYAIRRIPKSEVAETMALYEELMTAGDATDLMTNDVRNELSATRAGQSDDNS